MGLKNSIQLGSNLKIKVPQLSSARNLHSSGSLELGRFRAEPSQAGALWFSSWNRADNSDNMYVNKKQILVPTPKLQSNFPFFMNICKTIDISGVEYYDL